VFAYGKWCIAARQNQFGCCLTLVCETNCVDKHLESHHTKLTYIKDQPINSWQKPLNPKVRSHTSHTRQQDTTMPSGIDYEELSALSEDVFEALDNVLDDTTPGVTRLALTSISMLRFIETAVLDMTAKDLDSIEEMRRLQRSELRAASRQSHRRTHEPSHGCRSQGSGCRYRKVGLQVQAHCWRYGCEVGG
jgi:hypothetical protein